MSIVSKKTHTFKIIRPVWLEYVYTYILTSNDYKGKAY